MILTKMGDSIQSLRSFLEAKPWTHLNRSSTFTVTYFLALMTAQNPGSRSSKAPGKCSG